jgi:hypothetical protein
MDITGFLCVSLGSTTVQLHDNLGSRHACICSEARFNSQNGDHAWGLYYRRAAFDGRFLWEKDSMQKLLIKKCFLLTVGSVCRVKQFTTGLRIFSRTFGSCRWCSTISRCWDCDRGNCAVGAKVDSSWQEDHDRQCKNCIRVFPWFSIL